MKVIRKYEDQLVYKYDPTTDIITIEEIKFSGKLFRHFTIPDNLGNENHWNPESKPFFSRGVTSAINNKCYRLIRDDGGVVTIEESGEE